MMTKASELMLLLCQLCSVKVGYLRQKPEKEIVNSVTLKYGCFVQISTLNIRRFFVLFNGYINSLLVKANGSNDIADLITSTLPVCPPRISRIGDASLVSYSCSAWRHIPHGEIG
jgi:hypothetical protein